MILIVSSTVASMSAVGSGVCRGAKRREKGE